MHLIKRPLNTCSQFPKYTHWVNIWTHTSPHLHYSCDYTPRCIGESSAEDAAVCTRAYMQGCEGTTQLCCPTCQSPQAAHHHNNTGTCYHWSQLTAPGTYNFSQKFQSAYALVNYWSTQLKQSESLFCSHIDHYCIILVHIRNDSYFIV